MGQWIMRKGPIGIETHMMKETDRQTDTIEGRKAAFQGVQSVTRGEIANGVMVAEEQVKNRGKSESCGIHYATRPKPPSVFHFSASLVNNYSPKWRWIVKYPPLSPTLKWIILLVYTTQIPKKYIVKSSRKLVAWRSILSRRLFGSEYYLLFNSELANQCRRKAFSLVWYILILFTFALRFTNWTLGTE